MSRITITRVTHSCALIDFGGTIILTDPWFSEKPGYLRGEPLALGVGDLPNLAGVVISHDHYDHCDLAAFQAFRDKSVPVLAKRGLASKIRAAGFQNVTELDPWEQAQLGPVAVTATPAKHGVPEITFVLQGDGGAVYFGGDTLLIPELHELGKRFPRIDAALLPVNGLCIRPLLNRRVVMTDVEAAELCASLRPKVAIPIHYSFTAGPARDRLLLKYSGTADGFAKAAAKLAPTTNVEILAPGEPLGL